MRSTSLLGRAHRRRFAELSAFFLLSGAIGAACPAFASPDRLLPEAARLMERRDAAAAYALLRAEEPRRAGRPDFDYLLGISALDAGHVTHAIFALERVVATQPQNALARAELARAYLAAGETDHARTELEIARRSRLPDAAAAAIDRVLGALDQTLPPQTLSATAYAEFGAGWDSNVNSANNAGEFAIPAFGGLLFTVDPGHRRQSDAFAFAGAGVNLQLKLAPTWKAIVAAHGRGAWNHDVHEMNTRSVDTTLGLSHAAGAHVQTVALQSNTAWVSSSVYRSANGVSGQWQSQVDAASQWSAFAQWARQAYPGQRERDADRSVLGTAYARVFSTTRTLGYTSVYGAREQTRQDGYEHFGHRAVGWRVGVEQPFPQATVFAEWRSERRRYGGTEPLFQLQRIDRQADLTLGLRWAVVHDWSVVPSIRYTAARSNVQLYDHGRTVVQVAVRKEFP